MVVCVLVNDSGVIKIEPSERTHLERSERGAESEVESMITTKDMREGLEQMIRSADSEIARLTASRDAMVKSLQELERGVIRPFDTAESEESPAAAEPTKGLTHGEQVIQVMVEVLREEQPLKRDVILERVQSKGVPLTARKPINTIAQHLTNSDLFVNVEKGSGKWALREYVEAATAKLPFTVIT